MHASREMTLDHTKVPGSTIMVPGIAMRDRRIRRAQDRPPRSFLGETSRGLGDELRCAQSTSCCFSTVLLRGPRSDLRKWGTELSLRKGLDRPHQRKPVAGKQRGCFSFWCRNSKVNKKTARGQKCSIITPMEGFRPSPDWCFSPRDQPDQHRGRAQAPRLFFGP
jgi:hypothetical protein